MKRMTSEEKQSKLLNSLSFNTFYHIKELEKIALKHFRSSAKEIVEILVSENLLKQEKIGISNIFWKKPVNNQIELKKLEKAKKKLEENKIENQKILNEKRELSKNSKNIDLLKKLEKLKSEFESKTEEINLFVTESDFKIVEKKVLDCKSEGNKITDNIFGIIDYLKKKGKESKEIYKAFGLNEEFDHL